LLRWYSANESSSFPIGGNPIGLAYDGSSLWIVNIGTNSVYLVGGKALALLFPHSLWYNNSVSFNNFDGRV